MKINELVAHGVLGICLTAMIVVGARGTLAQGQEGAPPLPPEPGFQRVIILHRHEVVDAQQAFDSRHCELAPGVTIQVSGTAPCDQADGVCRAATACEELIARLGAPCNASACGEVCTLACDAQLGKFVSAGCACAASGECLCAANSGCGTDCKAACKCCSCGEQTKHDATLTAHAAHAAPHALIAKGHEHCPFMEQMVKLVADQAAAKAELASRREASQKFVEMYETMTELAAANAALHAKLEAQEEQAKLTFKLAELATENARLKAHVELAGGRSEAGQHALTLAVENERLKERIAELERKHAETESTRSAARVRAEKRAR